MTAPNAEPHRSRSSAWIAIAFIGIASLFLFARLGRCALWDDEAVTALSAEAVWSTGDTSVLVGHNVVGYANGRLLRGLADRSTPPLPAYIAAPFVGTNPGSALAARIPFAAMGVALVALFCMWIARAKADVRTQLFLAACTLGNVSLFLYFRNCRYYGPAILLSTMLVYQVLHYDGARWRLVAASLTAAALFATHYLAYGVLMLCLAVDYGVWQHKRRSLKASEWATFLAPQLCIAACVFSVWNTLDTANTEHMFTNGWSERFTLLAWTLRDMNACEYGAMAFLAAAPFVAWITRDAWLARAACALGVYVLVIGLFAPTPVSLRASADMRYLAPVIPLCIATSVLLLRALSRTPWRWIAVPLVCVLACSNLLHGGPLLRQGLRSTPLEFGRELLDPPRDPFSVTSEWIRSNVAPDASVFAVPSYTSYPLMFHAPHAIYAWQFDPPPRGDLARLSPIHFKGMEPPDYIVAFGPQALADVREKLFSSNDPGRAYDECAVLDVFWKDRYRPELMWRDFREVRGFDPRAQGVTVFKRRT